MFPDHKIIIIPIISYIYNAAIRKILYGLGRGPVKRVIKGAMNETKDKLCLFRR